MKDLTLDSLQKTLNDLYNKKTEKSFTIICNEKTFQIYNITVREDMGLLSTEEATLKRHAIHTNSYIYSKWDYLKYPQIYSFKNAYSNSFTNEIFEEGEEDYYGDCEMIYVGRKWTN